MFDMYEDRGSYQTCQYNGCGARLDSLRYGPMAWYCRRHEGGIDPQKDEKKNEDR